MTTKYIIVTKSTLHNIFGVVVKKEEIIINNIYKLPVIEWPTRTMEIQSKSPKIHEDLFSWEETHLAYLLFHANDRNTFRSAA